MGELPPGGLQKDFIQGFCWRTWLAQHPENLYKRHWKALETDGNFQYKLEMSFVFFFIGGSDSGVQVAIWELQGAWFDPWLAVSQWFIIIIIIITIVITTLIIIMFWEVDGLQSTHTEQNDLLYL